MIAAHLNLRRLMALLMALASTAALLALLKLSENSDRPAEPQLIVRKVNVAAPPPPPPPPPLQQPSNNNSTALDLSFNADGQAMAISFKASKATVQLKLPKPPNKLLSRPDWNINLKQDWQTFGLGDLDQLPRLLTPIRVDFPDSLKRRGINKALAKLHILIDESGQVFLKNISQLDYPELKPGLRQAVQQARFTSPKKSGLAVKAEFIWPVELEHS